MINATKRKAKHKARNEKYDNFCVRHGRNRRQGLGKIPSQTFEIFYSGGIECESGVAIENEEKQPQNIDHYQIMFYF